MDEEHAAAASVNDHQHDPKPQENADDPVEAAAEMDAAAESLMALANGPPVDATVLQAAGDVEAAEREAEELEEMEDKNSAADRNIVTRLRFWENSAADRVFPGDHARDPKVQWAAKILMKIQAEYRRMENREPFHMSFFKSLSKTAATKERLRITGDEARVLFPCFSNESCKGKDTRTFKMIDEKGRKYNGMKLVRYPCNKMNESGTRGITWEIKGEWRAFVKANAAKFGDYVRIYKNLNPTDHFDFMFKVVRNGGN